MMLSQQKIVGRKLSEDPRVRIMAMEDTVWVSWKMFILCELSTNRMASSEDIGFSTYLSIYLAEKSFENRIRGDGKKIKESEFGFSQGTLKANSSPRLCGFMGLDFHTAITVLNNVENLCRVDQSFPLDYDHISLHILICIQETLFPTLLSPETSGEESWRNLHANHTCVYHEIGKLKND